MISTGSHNTNEISAKWQTYIVITLNTLYDIRYLPYISGIRMVDKPSARKLSRRLTNFWMGNDGAFGGAHYRSDSD